MSTTSRRQGGVDKAGQSDVGTEAKITEHEGMLLALVLRQQPVTAYQLFRMFEQSPVTSINSSKGQLYPAIRRLRERGLLDARKVAGDGRKSEELSVTDAGHAAVREWTRNIEPSHIVLDDPLRTRILSFDVLNREERLEWIARAKALVKQRRAIVDEYDASVDVPFQDFAYSSVMETLRIKMEWLDELLYHVASPE
jgi:DNA-binding PadR family transcriptional regulator